MNHKYSTVFLILIMLGYFGLMFVLALTSEDIDDICSTDDKILKRTSGNWICADDSGNGSTTNNYYNNTYLNQFDQSLNTTDDVSFNNVLLGNSERPLFSTQDVQYTVCNSGCNYTTIQDAVNDVPYYIEHEYNISVQAGTYDEDVKVQNVRGNHLTVNNNERSFFRIEGNNEDPDTVKVKSFYIDNIKGMAFKLTGFQIYSTNPYTNEQAGVEFYSVDHGVFGRSNYTNGTNGFVCYSSKCNMDVINFGTHVLTGDAIVVKHLGFLDEQKEAGLPTSGTVNGSVYRINGGFVQFQGKDSTLSGEAGLYGGLLDTSNNWGWLYDRQNERFYDVDQFYTDGNPLLINSGGTDNALKIMSEDSAVDLRFNDTSSSNQAIVRFQSDNLIMKVDGSTDNFRINSSGHVSIGTAYSLQEQMLAVEGSGKFRTDTNNDPFYITRNGGVNEAFSIGVDDNGVIMESIQDETNGGMFTWKSQRNDDTSVNAYLWRVDSDNSVDTRMQLAGNGDFKVWGNVQIGSGNSQKNITLTSPNGNEWCCGVDNSGTFSCSAGAC